MRFLPKFCLSCRLDAASALMADSTGVSSRAVYNRALALKGAKDTDDVAGTIARVIARVRRAAEAARPAQRVLGRALSRCKFYRVLGRRVKTLSASSTSSPEPRAASLCFIEVKARARECVGRRSDHRPPASTHCARRGALLGGASRVTPQRCPIRRDTGRRRAAGRATSKTHGGPTHNVASCCGG